MSADGERPSKRRCVGVARDAVAANPSSNVHLIVIHTVDETVGPLGADREEGQSPLDAIAELIADWFDVSKIRVAVHRDNDKIYEEAEPREPGVTYNIEAVFVSVDIVTEESTTDMCNMFVDVVNSLFPPTTATVELREAWDEKGRRILTGPIINKPLFLALPTRTFRHDQWVRSLPAVQFTRDASNFRSLALTARINFYAARRASADTTLASSTQTEFNRWIEKNFRRKKD